MTETSTKPFFRFSTGEITESSASEFPWEISVPVNPFWDTFKCCIVASFLSNFTSPSLSNLPIEPLSTASRPEKLHLLLQLLQSKLEEEEKNTLPEILYEVDYTKWYKLNQGIYAMENELNLPSAEATVRMLVVRRPDPDNVVPPHMLAEPLVKIGKYKEAEEVEGPVCEWTDKRPHLGKNSPQAINARRIIAKALWGQGIERRGEAEKMVEEKKRRLVEEMKGGKFEVYVDEERRGG